MHPNFELYKTILLSTYKLSDKDLSDRLIEWKNKFRGSSDNDMDFLWSIFQQVENAILHTYKDSALLYQHLKDLYLTMWKFLIDEKRNATHMQKLINYCDLKKADSADYKTLAQCIATHCCSVCEEMDGLAIPVDQALSEQPLPNSACTRELGCICTYAIIAERDLEGNLLLK